VDEIHIPLTHPTAQQWDGIAWTPGAHDELANPRHHLFVLILVLDGGVSSSYAADELTDQYLLLVLVSPEKGEGGGWVSQPLSESCPYKNLEG